MSEEFVFDTQKFMDYVYRNLSADDIRKLIRNADRVIKKIKEKRKHKKENES